MQVNKEQTKDNRTLTGFGLRACLALQGCRIDSARFGHRPHFMTLLNKIDRLFLTQMYNC